MVKPEIYLGASLSTIDNEHGNECWTMSSDRYFDTMLQNMEEQLARQGLRLPSRVPTPLSHGYTPEDDLTAES